MVTVPSELPGLSLIAIKPAWTKETLLLPAELWHLLP
jgi:hypothetical protein